MKIFEGDVLSVNEGILVHGCNCQGVMGGGIAAGIRSKYPQVFLAYKAHEKLIGLRPGDVSYAWNPAGWTSDDADEVRLQLPRHGLATQLPYKLVVANALTQRFYGNDKSVRYVDYDAVFSAFARIRMLANASALPVLFPLIGAGLANGVWSDIKHSIKEGLGAKHFERSQLWLLPGVREPLN